MLEQAEQVGPAWRRHYDRLHTWKPMRGIFN
jgi:hypothetical protein